MVKKPITTISEVCLPLLFNQGSSNTFLRGTVPWVPAALHICQIASVNQGKTSDWGWMGESHCYVDCQFPNLMQLSLMQNPTLVSWRNGFYFRRLSMPLMELFPLVTSSEMSPLGWLAQWQRRKAQNQWAEAGSPFRLCYPLVVCLACLWGSYSHCRSLSLFTCKRRKMIYKRENALNRMITFRNCEWL